MSRLLATVVRHSRSRPHLSWHHLLSVDKYPVANAREKCVDDSKAKADDLLLACPPAANSASKSRRSGSQSRLRAVESGQNGLKNINQVRKDAEVRGPCLFPETYEVLSDVVVSTESQIR